MPVFFPSSVTALGDVDDTGLGDGDVLSYDATAGKWTPNALFLATGTPSDGQVIAWDTTNGAQWETP